MTTPRMLVLLPLTLLGLTTIQTAAAQNATTETPLTKAQCDAALKAKVNLNTASLETLKCLPGVPTSIGKDIILNRTYADQRDFEKKIETIGQRLWRGFSPYITLDMSKSVMAAPVPVAVSKANVAAVSNKAVHVGPLGDLSPLIKITEDTLGLVQSSKPSAAVTRIKALEVLWDKDAKALTAKNNAKWTTIDGAADQALSAVRSSTPSKAQSVKALQELLALLKAG
ncbi:hypothetical protein FNU79_17835 [Deinococcus detaillensis]|uniref:Helix-hairpin-helix domain-containing protein n=1 Tax=Deinococcus detaillensis TaxID=2592048 RepID=A0A553UH24_9DEIO|nr:hypothetical protein [Deinococcus detaillensis]TSA79507.1 hypothetical protein FNU79_17835 [Deinococcus detaillensis]